MTPIDTLPICKCGRTLNENRGVTWCPGEDAVQDIEKVFNPNYAPTANHGIDNWYNVGMPRKKSAFDLAHDAHFNRFVRETYPEQFN